MTGTEETNFELDIDPEETQSVNGLVVPELDIQGQELQESKITDVRKFDLQEKEIGLGLKRGFDLSEMSGDAVLSFAVDKLKESVWCMVDAGICFDYLKSQCQHGQFGKLLEERGINPVRASEAMGYSIFFLSLPENQQNQLLDLNKSKGMLLVNADPEVVTYILENDEKFEEYKQLTVRDMRKALRADKAKMADMDVQINTLNNQLKIARNRHTQISDDSDQPLFVVEARHESVALNKQANLALDSLEALYNEHLSRPYSQDQAPYNKAVSRALFHSSNELLVRIASLTQKMQQDFGEQITGNVNLEDHLPDGELIAIAKDYSLISQEHEHQAILREQTRQSKRPKTPGRPKKLVE